MRVSGGFSCSRRTGWSLFTAPGGEGFYWRSSGDGKPGTQCPLLRNARATQLGRAPDGRAESGRGCWRLRQASRSAWEPGVVTLGTLAAWKPWAFSGKIASHWRPEEQNRLSPTTPTATLDLQGLNLGKASPLVFPDWLLSPTRTRASVRLVHTAISSRVDMSG